MTGNQGFNAPKKGQQGFQRGTSGKTPPVSAVKPGVSYRSWETPEDPEKISPARKAYLALQQNREVSRKAKLEVSAKILGEYPNAAYLVVDNVNNDRDGAAYLVPEKILDNDRNVLWSAEGRTAEDFTQRLTDLTPIVGRSMDDMRSLGFGERNIESHEVTLIRECGIDGCRYVRPAGNSMQVPHVSANPTHSSHCTCNGCW